MSYKRELERLDYNNVSIVVIFTYLLDSIANIESDSFNIVKLILYLIVFSVSIRWSMIGIKTIKY
jgi:hypothetical protein